MNSVITADEIVGLIQSSIIKWHEDAALRSADYVIATDEIKRRRPMNQFRNDMTAIVKDLTMTNTEAWHVEDAIHSGQKDVVIKAVRNANVLNRHRNDVVEELDELILHKCENGGIS